jgi:hypothetical protein
MEESMRNCVRVAACFSLMFLFIGSGWGGFSLRTTAGPAEDRESKRFVPEPDRAVVYVFRDGSFLGRSLKSRLVVDDTAVTEEGAGQFSVVSLAPGAYGLFAVSSKESSALSAAVHNKKKTPVRLAAEPGQVYYFQESFSPGGGFALNAVPAEQAQPIIKKGKLSALVRL